MTCGAFLFLRSVDVLHKETKRFIEGVDRMFREMAEAGNPAPEYKQVEFMVKVKLTSALRDEDETVEKDKSGTVTDTANSPKTTRKTVEKTVEKIIRLIKDDPSVTIKGLSLQLSLTRRGIEEQIRSLKAKGRIRRVGPDKGGHWEVL